MKDYLGLKDQPQDLIFSARTCVLRVYELWEDTDNTANNPPIFPSHSQLVFDNATVHRIAESSLKNHPRAQATRHNTSQRPLATSRSLPYTSSRSKNMTKLTTSASIGIGVPLGVILLAAFAGIIYSVMAKRKNPRGDVELTKTDPTAPPAPAPKVIKWNPNGTMVIP